MTRDELIRHLAEILVGLSVPSLSGYYHLSTAYEPYMALRFDRRLTPKGVEAWLREILEPPLAPTVPSSDSASVTDNVKVVAVYNDYNWEED